MKYCEHKTEAYWGAEFKNEFNVKKRDISPTTCLQLSNADEDIENDEISKMQG